MDGFAIISETSKYATKKSIDDKERIPDILRREARYNTAGEDQ